MNFLGRGLLCAAAAWLLLQGSPALAAFSDVAADHPDADAIAYVQSQGIVSGYPDGTYRPDQPINRAEFTKIIVGAQFGAAADGACAGGSPFADIPAGAWYAGDVCLAKEKGVIAGYPDGTFKPDANVNFAEAAKIIVTAFGYSTSASGASAWYAPFVRTLDQRHAIPVGILGFDVPLTRGQMAEIIYRLRTKVMTKDSMTYGALAQAADIPPSASGIIPVNDVWSLYVNNMLGYSLLLPQHISSPSCGAGRTYESVGVTVLKDGNDTYITASQANEGHPCVAVAPTLDTLRPMDGTWPESVWKITVQPVRNDGELGALAIPNCGYETIPASQPGVFDVRAKPDDSPDCLMSWAGLILKYHPARHEAASWGMGTGVDFQTIDTQGNMIRSFDQEMADSFRFK